MQNVRERKLKYIYYSQPFIWSSCLELRDDCDNNSNISPFGLACISSRYISLICLNLSSTSHIVWKVGREHTLFRENPLFYGSVRINKPMRVAWFSPMKGHNFPIIALTGRERPDCPHYLLKFYKLETHFPQTWTRQKLNFTILYSITHVSIPWQWEYILKINFYTHHTCSERLLCPG